MADEEPLVVAEGRLSELDVLLLAGEMGPGAIKGGHGDLTMPFRAPSLISIGDPIASPLVAPSPTTAALPGEYEFYQVQLVCSFQAASGCRFTDARFAVEPSTVDDGTGSRPAETTDAIACDMFPLSVEDAQTVKVTSTMPTSEFSFGFEPLGATLSLPSRQRVRESIEYRSRIVAFDLHGTRPAWSFHRTDQHEIVGAQRLFLLVRKPRGTQVHATFSLSAHVQFVVGGRGFAPVELVMLFRRRGRDMLLDDAPALALC